MGLLLFELLYASKPPIDAEAIDPPPRLDLSTGLRDILAHCLHPDPAGRYPTAQALAEDLRRHLTDRPLLGVRNRSLAESWGKWRRRRPHTLLLWFFFALSLAAAAGFAAMHILGAAQQHQHAEQALSDGLQQLQARRFDDAAQTFQRALAQRGPHIRSDPLAAELERCLRRAVRAHKVQAVHEQVEQGRYLHSEGSLPPGALEALERRCRAAWDERESLLDSTDPLDHPTEETLRRDLLDAAILWADCHVRGAGRADAAEASRDALAMLIQAEALLGPSPVLSRYRQALRQSLGEPEEEEAAPPPRTAWEHYTFGRWLLDRGNLGGAAAAFDCAIALRPHDFWPWFGKGICAHRRARSDEAVTAFTVCIALTPESAACYHNRALVLAARGDRTLALEDYDRALALDPRFAAAALNRGVLHYQERRYAAATADLKLALTLGASPAAVHYNRALVHQECQEPAAALASVERALQHDPTFFPAHELRVRLEKQLDRQK
jgi:tetratricopeptide (TPR) repeat protein